MSAVPLRKGQMAVPVAPVTSVAKTWATAKGPCRKAWKLGIYGEAGVGKSSLAALCNGAVFADIEQSMIDLDVERVQGVENWSDLRSWVQAQTTPGTIRGIDSMTQAEDWATDFVIKTKKSPDGASAVTSIEDWKYKIGSRFVSDEFRHLICDIEASFRCGVSWIMVAHDRVDWVRNPDDKDYRQHVPDLLEAKDVSSRNDWVRFCDHLVFIGRDINVTKGKAAGGQTRTLYMDGAASRTCKMRGLSQDVLAWPMGDKALWTMMGVE